MTSPMTNLKLKKFVSLQTQRLVANSSLAQLPGD